MKTITRQTKEAALICLGLGLALAAISMLSGCCKPKDGSNGATGAVGAQGPQGNVGVTGSQGIQGIQGNTGAQGYGAGIQVTQVSPGANCANGGIEVQNYQDLNNNGQLDAGESLIGLSYVCNGVNGTNGTNGNNGTNGTNGTNGSNGVSSTFSVVTDSGAHCTNGGFDITLTDVNHSETDYVCNGNNGANGQNGQAGTNGTNGSNGGTVSFSLVQAIEPCGAASSPWKEVILGLVGGQLLSSFSETVSGQNTRFAFIPNGSYIDTDSSGCNFTVTGDGSTVSDISWNAGSNGYSTWIAGGYHWTQATGWVAH